MIRTGCLKPALLLSVALCLSGCVTTQESELPRTLAPLDFVRFCMDYRSECQSGHPNAVVALTSETRQAIEQVNTEVNRRISPVTRTAAWRINPATGNCNDYVVTKRHELMARGFPASALLIATARTREGEGHLLLIVRSDRGDLVLDNLTGNVLPRAQANYMWLARQSGADPNIWEMMSPVAEPVRTEV